MNGTEVCKFTMEEIAEAIVGLDGLQAIIGPFLLNLNHDGMGREDADQCAKHLMMGKHALNMLLEVMGAQP